MDVAKFTEEYLSNKTIGLIAKEFSVCEETIRNWAEKYNLPKRRTNESLVGKTFNFLYVEEETDKRYQGNIIYKCRCLKCGSYCENTTNRLKGLKIKTCGCLNKTGYKDITGKFWANVIKNAKIRNIEFDITKEEAWRLLEKQSFKCALSGLKISCKQRTASIDRISSKKSYSANNIQWVHKDVNMMKWKLEEKRFLELCIEISNFTKDKQCEYSI